MNNKFKVISEIRDLNQEVQTKGFSGLSNCLTLTNVTDLHFFIVDTKARQLCFCC